ncbi:MAG: hypothetical protein KZQ96_16960 [Candidatus Thiodiazotropha sp. (ex Lucinoma borealis)]|nr:hypothetical protein [Candidatus Thiodiazotropha sp. (ex Lucinoma borealis)]MCU7841835.1 hypothetical protein [Candidatus Thiodiazotropha sp. (ex Troendleina suluensis)]MCU7858216.1 hypothetical protein [Candidatus Thiodiazotropha sp. (ex Lucinoma borealis)]MCU7868593.1 hypothetical protein [Candidatus Thiodiazotropha sp. (ex Lucinoma borealis)]
MKRRIWEIAGLSLAILFLASCTTPDWRQVRVSPFANIHEEGISNPVLTADDVTDIEDAAFVADPFIFHEGDTWYMFFEVAKWNGSMHFGRIGLATSPDGINWSYDKIVLEESTHHSYPLVIKYYYTHYMVTESYLQREIRFYRANNFPEEWERVYTIKKCGDGDVPSPGQCIDTVNPAIGYIDPSIFRYNGKWWMFGNQGGNCYLYYSDNLLSGWVEHPLSPVVRNDNSKARPGGRAFVFDGDRIIRLAQKGNIRYGQRVRAFEVTTLTEDNYVEYEISEAAPFCTSEGVFCESGGEDSCEATSCDESEASWNLCGMHNLDPWWTGEHWLLVTDGYGCSDSWSIGIYLSTPLPSGGKDPFEERDIEIREDVSRETKMRPDIQETVEVR